MRITQIVLPGASPFERKCQRVDFATLSSAHEVVAIASVAETPATDVAHVYGPTPLPRAPFIGFAPPYVASSAPAVRRLAFRKATLPRVIVTPLDVERGRAPLHQFLPEAVEEHYFASGENAPPRAAALHRVGSYARPSIVEIVEQTIMRLHRFRDDIEWHLFEEPPSPADLAGVEAWVDPALDDHDFNGFVAEAIAAGKAVVASRTPINAKRLEQGRTGFLVPRNDPNELTHAILAALLKPEVARSKIEAARQTSGKFRPRQRLRILERIYQDLSP